MVPEHAEFDKGREYHPRVSDDDYVAVATYFIGNSACPEVRFERVTDSEVSMKGWLREELSVGRNIILDDDTCTYPFSPIVGFEIRECDGGIVVRTQNHRYWVDLLDPVVVARLRSLKYLKFGFLGFDEIIPDGFCDAGRDAVYKTDERFGPMKLVPPDPRREIIVVDANSDQGLNDRLDGARTILEGVSDEVARIKILALFVAGSYGGNRFDRRGKSLLRLCAEDIEFKKRPDGTLPIGTLDVGVCRHRAIVFKYLADRLGIKARLIRGNHGGGSGHAWNVVMIDEKYYIVDVSLHPGELIEINPDDQGEVVYYQRLANDNMRGGPGGHSIAY